MSLYKKVDSPTEQSDLPRANVLGVGVHAADMTAAVRLITKAVTSRTRGYICLTGVHGVMEAQRDPDFRNVLSHAALVLPDGMPTVWMGHLQGLQDMRRVFGPDLMLAVMAHRDLASCSHFLFGGAPGVAHELCIRVKQRLPTVQIAGYYTPPFRPLTTAEELHLSTLLHKARPDIMWIGLSTPKQERFMADYLPQLSTTLMIGVGAAFDFHTGRLKDSPGWVKSLGMQWAHRLLQEPRRLWRRYLYNNSSFILRASLQLTGICHYKLATTDTPHYECLKSRKALVNTNY